MRPLQFISYRVANLPVCLLVFAAQSASDAAAAKSAALKEQMRELDKTDAKVKADNAPILARCPVMSFLKSLFTGLVNFLLTADSLYRHLLLHMVVFADS